MKFKKNSKGALEISFGWLFAILAGIVIIFIALYFSSKLINVQQESISAQTGKEIGSLLNPLETGFESSQTTSITIPTETKINNICDIDGEFGTQSIQLDQKSFNKWVETDVAVSFYNKYIFSEKEIIGKKFYIFSKPFNFPFKIADLMYIVSSNERYCFVGATNEIENELSKLNQSNLILDECNEGDIQVCFGTKDCDINVNLNLNYVEKNNTKMYFVDDSPELMYAAIFSEKKIYECQIKRLMMRVEKISSLYLEKESLTQEKGCDNTLGIDLGMLSETAKNIEESKELEIVKIEADNVDEGNNARRCFLW
jgi:hypothetical protein